MSCLLILTIMIVVFFVIYFIAENFLDFELSYVLFSCSVLIITFLLILVIALHFFDSCSLESCSYHFGNSNHADDCQCNECVIDRCEVLRHGGTCQCDKCIECKNIDSEVNKYAG